LGFSVYLFLLFPPFSRPRVFFFPRWLLFIGKSPRIARTFVPSINFQSLSLFADFGATGAMSPDHLGVFGFWLFSFPPFRFIVD